MELIPIPYFGMILSLVVVPGMTFGFILFLKKIKADVEKMSLKIVEVFSPEGIGHANENGSDVFYFDSFAGKDKIHEKDL